MTIEITSNDSSYVINTVELKTSTPGVTRTEQIKTGYKNVSDYSRYLQEKYSYMNAGITSMQGVPTMVSVSSAFLKKCMNDPEKAKYLEENLAVLPDCAKSAVAGCRGTLTNLSYQIDANGNISVAVSGTNDPDGKMAKENAKRKAQEKKTADEKAEDEKAAERRAEKKAAKEAGKETDEYTVSAAGMDTKTVTQNVIAASLGTSALTTAGFDIRA